MLLQIVEKSLQTTPYNSIGYGLLVAVLVVAVGALWMKLQHEQKKDQENFVKVTEIMTKFLLSFEEDKNLREEVRTVIMELKLAKEDYKNKAKILERVEVKISSIYNKIIEKE